MNSIQLQVNLQSNVSQPDFVPQGEDDIDSALNDLQVSLEGTRVNNRSIMRTPELCDSLRVMKPKKFTLKGWKKYHVTCRDLYMNFQKSQRDPDSVFSISLKGCEVTPDVNLAQQKFGIKLEVPGHDGMTEYWMRCDSVSAFSEK